MDPPEIPVFDEDTEPKVQVDAAAGTATPPGEGLTLALPPATAAAGPAAPPARRWSLDLASSTHSDWELLSAGHPSHCGSSPRSVSPSDAFDSEGEAEHAHHADRTSGQTAAAPQPAGGVEGPTEEPAAAPSAAAGAPAATSPAAAEAEPWEEQQCGPGQEGFGTLVTASEAAAAGPAVDKEEAAGPEDNKAEACGAGSGSPRSSYERPSSHASGHDLYSLSHDGSTDSLSEDEYIGSMMMQGEPDHSVGGRDMHDVHAGLEEPAGAKQAHANSLLAATPAAAVAAAVHGAAAAASRQLQDLAVSVSAMLARFVPVAADVARHVLIDVAAIVGSLREHAAALPARLAPLLEAGKAKAVEVQRSARAAAHHMQKNLGNKKVSWAKVALLLGVACGGLATMLYRSWQEQARLAAALNRREGDLSKLLMKVMELQRNITHRGAPIIRHVAAANSGAGAPYWPAVVAV